MTLPKIVAHAPLCQSKIVKFMTSFKCPSLPSGCGTIVEKILLKMVPVLNYLDYGKNCIWKELSSQFRMTKQYLISQRHQ